MKNLFCDLETYSNIDIRNGTYAYCEDVEVLIFAYAVDDEPAKVWDLTSGAAMPADLHEGLTDPTVRLVWHNGANFDRTVLMHAKNLRIPMPIERIDDTMVMALSHGLIGSLGGLCDILHVPQDKAKDKRGRQLIQKFCKLYRGRRCTSETDPEDWAHFKEYARLDVEAMREIWKKLPRWNWREYDRQLFAIDRRINDRGMLIDVELAQSCVDLANTIRDENDVRTSELTDGQLASANQRDALLGYLNDTYAVDLKDMRRTTIEENLAKEDLPPVVSELLAVRLSSAKASVSKYKKLIAATNSDHRLRGCLQFRGASRTGRFSGRTFQPQNLPRPTLKQEIIDLGIPALKEGWSELVAEPNALMSSALRSVICAPKGLHLVVADLSNIEGRVLAWLAGEEWKLEAFRQADAGAGHDLYKLTYGRTFGVNPAEVTKQQRQIGKVEELALGYRGGVGAFLTFASAYGINLDELARHVRGAIADDLWREAESSYDWFLKKKATRGLGKETFIALDAIKRGWRQSHPAISAFWLNLEEGCVRAIEGETVRVGRLTLDRQGSWLRMRLPSGRYLCYPGARDIRETKGVGVISFLGVDQRSRKWTRISTHGGKLAENATQAVALDVLAEAMPRIEAEGFRIVLSIHDEFITEAGLDKTEHDLVRLMATTPPWGAGLPLNAAGFTADRYRKD